MIEPKEITITTGKGDDRTYIISKFPAVAGREIVAKYPISNIPKLGDYGVSEEVMLKLMSYISVPIEGANPIPLKSRVLVDNHVPDWETLAKLEIAMMEYNCSFFGNGLALNFFSGLAQKAQAMISKMLTDSLVQSSQTEKPPTTN